MQAMVYTEYGALEVLQPQEVENPVPMENEVLVRVYAASVNPGDLHILRGMGRFVGNGLLKPKHTILGSDMAGRVEAVGRNVTGFAPEDEVFGDLSAHGWGAFAEYVAVPADALVRKPTNLTFAQAAAVPMAGVTAIYGLRDKGGIAPGQKVLINGASGGVGTFAVSIAKSFDTEVTAVCSKGKMAMAHKLGADHVLDYAQEDFTQSGQQYDLIFDTVGNRSIAEYKRALRPHGSFVTTAFLPILLLQGPWLAMTEDKNMRNLMSRPSTTDLAFLGELIQAGKVTPMIDRCYPFPEIQDAMRYLAEGHARGKVVISLN